MSPTELSLREMRKRGYRCQVVEHYHFYAKKRIDLFGIIDIVCIGRGKTVGLQTTSYSNISSHRKKIIECEARRDWIGDGNRILLHGWKKKEGRWILKEEEFAI